MTQTQTHTAEAGDVTTSYQSRVDAWLIACFGETIARDRQERNHRFLEEALELVQACECTAGEAHQLVDYVFGRPIGDPRQESGGVSNTHAALCLAQGIDMEAAAEAELARVWTKVEKIRAKQAAKPKHSPLPEASPAPRAPAAVPEELRRLSEAADWIEGAIAWDRHSMPVQVADRGLTLADYVRTLAAAPAAPPADGGTGTDALVDRFADALKARLRLSKDKPGRGAAWASSEWRAVCQHELLRHIGKGDPLDVAAYTAFCWHHGWSTAADAALSSRTPAGAAGDPKGRHEDQVTPRPAMHLPDPFDATRPASPAPAASAGGEGATERKTEAPIYEAFARYVGNADERAYDFRMFATGYHAALAARPVAESDAWCPTGAGRGGALNSTGEYEWFCAATGIRQYHPCGFNPNTGRYEGMTITNDAACPAPSPAKGGNGA